MTHTSCVPGENTMKKKHLYSVSVELMIEADSEREAYLKTEQFLRYGCEETASIIPPSGLNTYSIGTPEKLK